MLNEKNAEQGLNAISLEVFQENKPPSSFPICHMEKLSKFIQRLRQRSEKVMAHCNSAKNNECMSLNKTILNHKLPFHVHVSQPLWLISEPPQPQVVCITSSSS